MNEIFVQLGVGGIFAVLVIREFVNLVTKMKGRNGNGNGTIQDVKDITIDTNDKVKTLHSLHSKTDPDGMPLWYFPRSMVKSQEQIAQSQSETTSHLKDISELLKKKD